MDNNCSTHIGIRPWIYAAVIWLKLSLLILKFISLFHTLIYIDVTATDDIHINSYWYWFYTKTFFFPILVTVTAPRFLRLILGLDKKEIIRSNLESEEPDLFYQS